LFVRLEIIPPNDEHSQDFERRRDAVENLDTARLEDLRANWLVGDDRVHLASAKRGEVTIWRQVDEPHVARRETSLLERAIEQVRVNLIDLGCNAPILEISRRDEIGLSDHGITAARFVGQEQNHRVHRT